MTSSLRFSRKFLECARDIRLTDAALHRALGFNDSLTLFANPTIVFAAAILLAAVPYRKQMARFEEFVKNVMVENRTARAVRSPAEYERDNICIHRFDNPE